MFLESCSTPAAAPEPVAGWYEGTLYEDKPFYITKNAISWTSRKGAQNDSIIPCGRNSGWS